MEKRWVSGAGPIGLPQQPDECAYCLFFRHSPVGSGSLEGGHHLLRTDLMRVIEDGVDLAEPLKSPGHFFDPRQPFQG